MLLLLFGDISLNPGPVNSSGEYSNDQWAVFKKRGLHFVHININSLLPKINFGISESKLDDSVLYSELQSYDLIRSDMNRHGGGVACFIRNDHTTQNHSFPLRQKIYS